MAEKLSPEVRESLAQVSDMHAEAAELDASKVALDSGLQHWESFYQGEAEMHRNNAANLRAGR